MHEEKLVELSHKIRQLQDENMLKDKVIISYTNRIDDLGQCKLLLFLFVVGVASCLCHIQIPVGCCTSCPISATS